MSKGFLQNLSRNVEKIRISGEGLCTVFKKMESSCRLEAESRRKLSDLNGRFRGVRLVLLSCVWYQMNERSPLVLFATKVTPS